MINYTFGIVRYSIQLDPFSGTCTHCRCLVGCSVAVGILLDTASNNSVKNKTAVFPRQCIQSPPVPPHSVLSQTHHLVGTGQRSGFETR
jgi:hypothetical protein